MSDAPRSAIRVEPATAAHLDQVRATYAHARALQLARAGVAWPLFPDAKILAEMAAGQLYRVIDGDALAGVFSAMDEDHIIWGELERGAHIYLHRIARAPTYRGGGLVREVLAWARARCRPLGLDGLRMDTWADNEALIGYYVSHGFHVVARRRLFEQQLPAHYYGVELVLLERALARERDQEE